MRVDDFIRTLPEQYYDWETDQCHLKDDELEKSVAGVYGMSGLCKLRLIRHAVSFLEEGEVYMEAGVLHGMSLICTLKNNAHLGIGIDNWSEYPTMEGNAVKCKQALLEAGISNRVELIESDFKAVLTMRKFPPVGVYYYDANHDYFETLAGLELVYPHLSEQALIIVDDSDWGSPRRAIDEFLHRYSSATNEHGQAQMVFDLHGESWTTGMVAIAWNGLRLT